MHPTQLNSINSAIKWHRSRIKSSAFKTGKNGPHVTGSAWGPWTKSRSKNSWQISDQTFYQKWKNPTAIKTVTELVSPTRLSSNDQIWLEHVTRRIWLVFDRPNSLKNKSLLFRWLSSCRSRKLLQELEAIREKLIGQRILFVQLNCFAWLNSCPWINCKARIAFCVQSTLVPGKSCLLDGQSPAECQLSLGRREKQSECINGCDYSASKGFGQIKFLIAI